MSALPVHYYQSAWMDNVFRDNNFIPLVKKYLADNSLPSPYNAPSHPSTATLVSVDGNIYCLFLQTSVTSILQQGVLENLKCRYKRELLSNLLLDSKGNISFIE